MSSEDWIEDFRRRKPTTYKIKYVTPADVVNGDFAPGLFRTKGGHADYDQVFMSDGGRACYLVRMETTDQGLKIVKRWIPWNKEIEQLEEID